MARAPNVCLSLVNKPENAVVVRQALTGLAECLDLGAIETNDLNTAVSEACNNVAMHAYDGDEGPLEVDVYALAGELEVVVRDRGRGIDTGGDPEHEGHPGIGMRVIEALAREAEFAEREGGGTEVRMRFAAPDARAFDPVERAGARAIAEPSTPPARHARPSDEVTLELAPNSIARTVLPRVLSTLAARAHFSTDRISDVQLVADVLAANAGDSIDGSHMVIEATASPRRLELRVGPLHAGRGQSLMAAPADGLAPVVERLTDLTRVAPAGSGETLELALIDRR